MGRDLNVACPELAFCVSNPSLEVSQAGSGSLTCWIVMQADSYFGPRRCNTTPLRLCTQEARALIRSLRYLKNLSPQPLTRQAWPKTLPTWSCHRWHQGQNVYVSVCTCVCVCVCVCVEGGGCSCTASKNTAVPFTKETLPCLGLSACCWNAGLWMGSRSK